MAAIFGTGYELLMVIWGTVFILGAIGFIVGMNRVFQIEQHRDDAARGIAENAHVEERPLHPVA